MTTSTIEQIFKHSSIRHYREDPLPKETVEKIIAAGQRGSTSSNLQTYSVVAVTNKEKRDRLSEFCGNQSHIRQAPVFLAWCADLARLDTVCRMRGYNQETDYVESFLVAVVDAAIAMQTATLAAESMGLGMCYIGAIRNHPEKVIELLDLPRHVFPISGMTLRWPDTASRLRPRLSLSAVLHWEQYSEEGLASDLLAYDRTMIETGIYKGREVPVPGGTGEVEMYGWMEHSARRVSRRIRTGLRKALSDQGFELL
jgi:FMN reductase (NADPH)